VAFTLEYHCAASPDIVFETLRREAPYWRESQVPPPLRKGGALGVGIRLRPPRFELYFETNREYGLTWYDIRGVVKPVDTGGTRVVAHAGIQRRYISTAAVLWVVAAWVFLSNRIGGILLMLAAAGLSMLYYQVDRRVTRDSDPAARHLADRLDVAMATLAAQ
jgi:hypothetical protein